MSDTKKSGVTFQQPKKSHSFGAEGSVNKIHESEPTISRKQEKQKEPIKKEKKK